MGHTATDPGVTAERRGRILHLAIHRPEAMNALTPAMMEVMADALAANASDGTLIAVVIAGRGDVFCVGADLKAAQENVYAGADDRGREFVARASALMRQIECFPAPVIAAVNGLALAGGLELVLCCDLAVAVSTARFGDAHANYGLLPGAGGSARLPRRIGALRAKQMMFTAELIDAEHALRWGLINDICAPHELEPKTEALVAKLAAKSPLGLRRMKRLINEGLDVDIEAALTKEFDLYVEHSQSRDRKEGLAAFSEKRKPLFLGH
jgi:enoyl-CoA hydratase